MTTTQYGKFFTAAALDNIEEAAGVEMIDDDLALIKSGSRTPESLLEICLLGAEPDREQGWRDYVAGVFALAQHRAEIIEADEPREWSFSDDHSRDFARETLTRDEVGPALVAAINGGDYGQDERTQWVPARATCAQTGERVDLRVTLDPPEPDCVDDKEHDWQSPVAIVGGIRENPGVWGNGGGALIVECCMHCGCSRTTDTWAQDPSTGEQGLTAVRYEPGAFREALAEMSEEDADETAAARADHEHDQARDDRATGDG